MFLKEVGRRRILIQSTLVLPCLNQLYVLDCLSLCLQKYRKSQIQSVQAFLVEISLHKIRKVVIMQQDDSFRQQFRTSWFYGTLQFLHCSKKSKMRRLLISKNYDLTKNYTDSFELLWRKRIKSFHYWFFLLFSDSKWLDHISFPLTIPHHKLIFEEKFVLFKFVGVVCTTNDVILLIHVVIKMTIWLNER